MSGKLIIIESGSDASGKATQTKKLYERLLKDGYNVLSSPDINELYNKIVDSKIDKSKEKINYYGDGNAAQLIVEIIEKTKVIF